MTRKLSAPKLDTAVAAALARRYVPGAYTFVAATENACDADAQDTARDADMWHMRNTYELGPADLALAVRMLDALQAAAHKLRTLCYAGSAEPVAREDSAGGYRSGRRNYSHHR